MLQFEHSSRQARTTGKNFIAKNRSSVKDKSRKEVAKKAEREVRNHGHKEPQRGSKQPLDSRSTGPQKKLGGAGGGGGADTVTVSRDYLQQLLHSSLMREHVEDFNSLPVSLAPLSYRPPPPPPPPPPHHKEYSTVPTSRSTHEYDREREKKHVITDHSHVPGLSEEHWDRGGEYDGYESRGQWNRERDGYDMSPHPAAKGTLRTAHNQWLDDIAAQVREKQKEKERLKREKLNERVEEYFPFGRPGCGAPIRSESGTLLVNYQERASMRDTDRGRRYHSPSPPPRHRYRSPSPPPRHRYRSPSPPHRHRYRSPSPPPRGHTYSHRFPSPSPSPPPHHYHDRLRSPSSSPPPMDSYHRGTTNRPVHPSMKSSIPFGPGAGGGGGGSRYKEKHRERERTRKPDDHDHRSSLRKSPVQNHTTSHSRTQPQQHKTTGPRFGRGAGPHVNEYVLQEKNERARKEEQHKEFLKQQILEKKRQKEAEKLRREREEHEDELRIQREREQIEREYQRERERVRQKAEVEARRQAFMQEKIRLAEEAAIRAREEAKRMKAQGRRNPQSKTVDSVQHNSYQHQPNMADENDQQYQVLEDDEVYYSNHQTGSYRGSKSLPVPSTHQHTDPGSRSPSMHQGEEQENHQHSPRHAKNTSKVVINRRKIALKRGNQKTGSNHSLYSTSSEEPAAAMQRRGSRTSVEATGGVQRRGSKARVELTKKKVQSVADQEPVSHHRNVVRRHESNQTDSESDRGNYHSHGKASFAAANSVARAGRMKPGMMKEPLADSHGRTKKGTSQPTHFISTEQTYHQPLPPPTSPPVPALARKLVERNQLSEPPRQQPSLPSISKLASQQQNIGSQPTHSHQQQGKMLGVVEQSNPVHVLSPSPGVTDSYAHRSQSLPTPSMVDLPPLPPLSNTLPRPTGKESRHTASNSKVKLAPVQSDIVISVDGGEKKHSPVIEVLERPPSSSPEYRVSCANTAVDVSWTKSGVCCLPPLVEVSSSQELKSRFGSSHQSNLSFQELEQRLQSQALKQQQQDVHIRFLQKQLHQQQQRYNRELLKQHSDHVTAHKQQQQEETTKLQQQQRMSAEQQQAMLKQLASLKKGILHSQGKSQY